LGLCGIFFIKFKNSNGGLFDTFLKATKKNKDHNPILFFHIIFKNLKI